jgi:hypothetical protein
MKDAVVREVSSFSKGEALLVLTHYQCWHFKRATEHASRSTHPMSLLFRQKTKVRFFIGFGKDDRTCVISLARKRLHSAQSVTRSWAGTGTVQQKSGTCRDFFAATVISTRQKNSWKLRIRSEMLPTGARSAGRRSARTKTESRQSGSGRWSRAPSCARIVLRKRTRNTTRS